MNTAFQHWLHKNLYNRCSVGSTNRTFARNYIAFACFTYSKMPTRNKRIFLLVCLTANTQIFFWIAISIRLVITCCIIYNIIQDIWACNIVEHFCNTDHNSLYLWIFRSPGSVVGRISTKKKTITEPTVGRLWMAVSNRSPLLPEVITIHWCWEVLRNSIPACNSENCLTVWFCISLWW